MITGIRTATNNSIAASRQLRSRELRRGFLAVVPLWPGVVPFAVAYAVLARASGYSAIETQLMSLLVFAGSAQLAMVTLYAGGAAAITIVLTALILNLRHILYGLSADRQLDRGEQPRRSIVAFFLTDETYGITTREWQSGRGSAAFMLGTGFGLYVAFAIATLAGVLFGSLIPNIEASGIDFIFPLSFLALLVPLLRSRMQIMVAVIAAVVALVAGQFFNGGVTILLATMTAALTGMLLEHRTERA
jgi:4-azaleucine resistance transporter AzlC